MYGEPPAHDTQRIDGSCLLHPVMGEEWAPRRPRAARLAILPGRDPWRPRGPPTAWHPPTSALSGCSSGVTAPFVTRCGSTGPRFILKGNVAGGGGKRNKLSRFFFFKAFFLMNQVCGKNSVEKSLSESFVKFVKAQSKKSKG